MRSFNDDVSETLHVGSTSDWVPSEFVTKVEVEDTVPLSITNFAVAFPALREIEFGTDDATGGNALRFPSTLESMTVLRISRQATLLRQLGSHGAAHLCRLRALVVGKYPAGLGVASLAVFAPTLTTVVFEARLTKTWHAGELAAFEGTLSQLTSLEVAEVYDLPSARCFIGGKHKHLRIVSVGRAHGPTHTFGALAKACPRLWRALSVDITAPFAVPSGWVAKNGVLVCLRPSIVAIRRSFDDEP
jgi:hypothetical protein